MTTSTEDSKAQIEADPKDVVIAKETEVRDTITNLFNDIQKLESTTLEQIEEINSNFKIFAKHVQKRKRILIQNMKKITIDKKEMLMKQCSSLSSYMKELELEKKKLSPNVSICQHNIDLVTEPTIDMNINADIIAKYISKMVHVDNKFPPNPPAIEVSEIKAHTCKVRFVVGNDPYDGFQKPAQHIVQLSIIGTIHDEHKTEENADLVWEQVADRTKKKFARLSKLKPGMRYLARVQSKNDYGWGSFCEPVPFTTVELKIDTKIMRSDEIESLIEAIKAKRKKKEIRWTLLYRGSEDGFAASKFHQKCDGIKDTVVIVQSDIGNVFGGFTRLPWVSDVGRYRVDEEAFVFLLRKKDSTLKKGAKVFIQYRSSQHSVCHNKYMGPIFGYGHDIYIRSNCDKVEDNTCRNHTYRCDYAAQLGGKEKYRVIDYEMFHIEHEKERKEDEQYESDGQINGEEPVNTGE